MRSTRATSAIARLNNRSKDHHYVMAQTGAGLFYVSERIDGSDERVSDLLALDDFVRFVDAMGPQQSRRMTKNDVFFSKQLFKKAE
jgi:hypothetical protein